MSADRRSRQILAALELLQQYASGEVVRRTGRAEERSAEQMQSEMTAALQRATSFLMAAMWDQAVPVKLYKEFASYSALWRWEKEGKLKMERKHGKPCLRPSEFFRFWATLKGGSK